MDINKTCTKCQTSKSIEKFYRDKYRKDGRDGWCKECKYEQELLGNRRNFAKNVDAVIDWSRKKKCSRCKELKQVSEFNRQYKTKDGFQTFCKTCERARKLDKKYNLTQNEFLQMYKNQSGICPICIEKYLPQQMVIDHNHVTNVVRALLCDKCNRGIGFLRDDATICRLASEYLTKAEIVS